jgi:TRAP-type C4-dicarboxylate transport system permease large subunit
MITPPLGINVFAIKSIAPDIPLSTIFKGVVPFWGADLVRLALLVLFPALTLYFV